jgi:hypothetical protein
MKNMLYPLRKIGQPFRYSMPGWAKVEYTIARNVTSGTQNTDIMEARVHTVAVGHNMSSTKGINMYFTTRDKNTRTNTLQLVGAYYEKLYLFNMS